MSTTAPAPAPSPTDLTDAVFTSLASAPKWDAVVVGSGMGGLAAAGALARAGERVLLLESHAVLGGCTQVFRERGLEFDTGLH